MITYKKSIEEFFEGSKTLEVLTVKAADRCLFAGQELSISDVLKFRAQGTTFLSLTCIRCGKPVRAHKASKNGPAHFEHHERNYACPYSAGKNPKESFDVDDKRAIEGYQRDQKILTGARNQELARQCKVRDKYTCQACGFKLKHNGRYVIECHHKDPIALGGIRETRLEDLVSLCPTCHRIAHTRRDPLDIDEIALAREGL